MKDISREHDHEIIPVLVLRETGIDCLPFLTSWLVLKSDLTSKSGWLYTGIIDYPPAKATLILGKDEELIRIVQAVYHGSKGKLLLKELNILEKGLLVKKIEIRKDTDGSFSPIQLELGPSYMRLRQ